VQYYTPTVQPVDLFEYIGIKVKSIEMRLQYLYNTTVQFTKKLVLVVNYSSIIVQ